MHIQAFYDEMPNTNRNINPTTRGIGILSKIKQIIKILIA